MNERQKKTILKTLITLGLLGSIGLSITWLILILESAENIQQQIKEWITWAFANFGSLTLGLILKYLLNKRHVKEIKQTLDERGIEVFKRKEKEEKLYNGFRITIDDKNNISIVDTLNRSQLEVLQFSTNALQDFIQDVK